MTKKRIFRCCISFLVICCVLFNFVTVPARAAATAIASGIIALLFSIGMGIVAVDLTMQAIGGYRTSLEKAGIELYQNDLDKQSDFLTWIQNLGKDAEDGIIETTDTARDAIRHWGAGLMTGDGIEFDVEVAPEGYCYYGDACLPRFHDKHLGVLNNVGVIKSSSSYYFVFTDGKLGFSNSGVWVNPILSGKSYTGRLYVLDESNMTWKIVYSSTAGGFLLYDPNVYGSYTLVWNCLDISEFEGSSSKTDIITPSVFVGDIAGKIQSGEADEDQIYVPERLNITQILTGEVDDLDAVNDISSQLAAGTLTLEQYLEMTQVKDDTQAGTDVWVPPSDPGIYALDLTSYFPFCIPFDLFDFFSCLAADPVAPVIHWEVALPGGSSMPVDIDLSPFDSVAQLLRRLQLLLFAVGLAIKTRDLIRG